MSNAEVRVARSLSPSANGAFAAGRAPRSGPLATAGARRRHIVVAWLVAGDLLVGVIAVVTASVTVAGAIQQGDIIDWLQVQMPVMLLFLIGICCSLGLYRPSAKSLVERFRLRAMAMLLFAFVGMFMLIPDGLSVGLLIVPLAGMIALVLGLWVEHLIGAQLIRRGMWGAPTAILGAGDASRAFARLLMANPGWGLNPIGFIDDGARAGIEVDNTPDRPSAGGADAALPLLGSLDGWHADGCAEVLVVPDCRLLPRDPSSLYRLGVGHILVVNQVGELPTFGLQVRHFDRCIALELGGRQRDPSPLLKRVVDLAVALPLAVFATPIVGLLALVIKIIDPGPAFYGQRRVGHRGRPIQVLKLRTMYRDAEQRLDRVLESDPAVREQWQRHFKLQRDPRILPHIGNFLRRTSLDELPQLWNVIRGDMSLVGPRPFPAYHLDAFDSEFRALRTTVPPGLTGLWQISSRSNGDLELQRAQDCFYIRNRSLWLDLYVLIATFPAVIRGQGAK